MLAPVFEGWFDRFLVDAPCSGEGMFRKDESMIGEWEKHSVERCSLMQRDIETCSAYAGARRYACLLDLYVLPGGERSANRRAACGMPGAGSCRGTACPWLVRGRSDWARSMVVMHGKAKMWRYGSIMAAFDRR